MAMKNAHNQKTLLQVAQAIPLPPNPATATDTRRTDRAVRGRSVGQAVSRRSPSPFVTPS